MNRPIAAIIAVTILSGCASSGPRLEIPEGTYTPVQGAAAQGVGLPPPNSADTASDVRAYQIGPYDRLRIEVFGVEDMNREVQADANGEISFPLAGAISAAGKSPRDLEREITELLRTNHMRDPRVTVNVTEAVSQTVTLDGQVTQPGIYPVVGRMTLVRAIAGARGTTEFARDGNVLVFRRVNGQDLVGLYNLRAIRQGFYPDPEIFPNDVIVVDEARARRLFRDILQLAPILTTPLVALAQNQ